MPITIVKEISYISKICLLSNQYVKFNPYSADKRKQDYANTFHQNFKTSFCLKISDMNMNADYHTHNHKNFLHRNQDN